MSNLKRFLALTLAIIMIVSGMAFNVVADDDDNGAVVTPPVAETKSDLDLAIEELFNHGIVRGAMTADGSFDFNGAANVNRQEFALFTARISTGTPEVFVPMAGLTPRFPDATDPTFIMAINHCFEEGIVNGRSADTYAPFDTITLHEAVAMLVRSLGWKDLSFVAEYSKAFEASVGLLGQYAAKFPIIGTAREDGTIMAADTLLTRNDMARLLYNYLYTDKRNVRVIFNAAGHPITEEEFIPVLAAFGYRVFEAYVTGVSHWAIDMRVPAPGLVNPATNSWFPVRLFGSTVVPTDNDINLVNRTHNVRLSWVTLRNRRVATTSEATVVPAAGVVGITDLNNGFVAESHTETYSLAQLGLTADNLVDMLGRKVRVRTNTRSATIATATTASFVSEILPIDLKDPRIVTPDLDNGNVRAGFQLPYDPISATAVAGRDSIRRTDSLYVFNNAAGVRYPWHNEGWHEDTLNRERYAGNKLRSASSDIDAPAGNSEWGANVGGDGFVIPNNNHELTSLVLANRNGQKYQLYLVHNGYFGRSDQINITQEYFYVMRPYRVGIRAEDATDWVGAGVRFYDNTTSHVLRIGQLGAGSGEEYGALSRDLHDGWRQEPKLFLRTGIAWNNAKFANDDIKDSGKAGEAFFYELRGYGHADTRELLIHEKLIEQDTGELTAAIGGDLIFAGGPVARMTFNENITAAFRGSGKGAAWSGATFGSEIAGTQGGSIGYEARDRTYRLFSIPETTNERGGSKFAVALELTRPTPADFAWSQYAVVLSDSGDWNIPIRSAANNNIIGLGTYVEILNASTNRKEQIIINSVNGQRNAGSATALTEGDRIRLVSRSADGVAWDVIRESAVIGAGPNYDINTGSALLSTGFAQTTAANTRNSANGAREYTFGNFVAPRITDEFLTRGTLTGIRQATTVSTTLNADAPLRAVITNNTKLVIYTSAGDGDAAVTTGTAAQITAFLTEFLRGTIPGNATNLRVVAERPVYADPDPDITSAGVARYIFIDTTRSVNDITMTPPIMNYGLVTEHHDHWFRALDRNGLNPNTLWRRGTIKSYNAAGQLADVQVCWPEVETNNASVGFARGTFVAVTNETRIDGDGQERNVIRFVDNTAAVAATLPLNHARLDDAKSVGALLTDGGVRLRVEPITHYIAGNNMMLIGENGIDLSRVANDFNFISRLGSRTAEGGVTTADPIHRYWGHPTEPWQGWGHESNSNPANRLWYGSFNNHREVRTSPNRNDRRFEELDANANITLWAIVYQANVVGTPLLSLTIVIDSKDKDDWVREEELESDVTKFLTANEAKIVEAFQVLLGTITRTPTQIKTLFNGLIDALEVFDAEGKEEEKALLDTFFESMGAESTDKFVEILGDRLDDIAEDEISDIVDAIVDGGTLGSTLIPQDFLFEGSVKVMMPKDAVMKAVANTGFNGYLAIITALETAIGALDARAAAMLEDELETELSLTDAWTVEEILAALADARAVAVGVRGFIVDYIDELDASDGIWLTGIPFDEEAEDELEALQLAWAALALLPDDTLEATVDFDEDYTGADAQDWAAILLGWTDGAELDTFIENLYVVAASGLMDMADAEWEKAPAANDNGLFATTSTAVTFGRWADGFDFADLDAEIRTHLFRFLHVSLDDGDKFTLDAAGRISELEVVATRHVWLDKSIVANTLTVTVADDAVLTLDGTAYNVTIVGKAAAANPKSYNLSALVYDNLVLDGEFFGAITLPASKTLDIVSGADNMGFGILTAGIVNIEAGVGNIALTANIAAVGNVWLETTDVGGITVATNIVSNTGNITLITADGDGSTAGGTIGITGFVTATAGSVSIETGDSAPGANTGAGGNVNITGALNAPGSGGISLKPGGRVGSAGSGGNISAGATTVGAADVVGVLTIDGAVGTGAGTVTLAAGVVVANAGATAGITVVKGDVTMGAITGAGATNRLRIAFNEDTTVNVANGTLATITITGLPLRGATSGDIVVGAGGVVTTTLPAGIAAIEAAGIALTVVAGAAENTDVTVSYDAASIDDHIINVARTTTVYTVTFSIDD